MNDRNLAFHFPCRETIAKPRIMKTCLSTTVVLRMIGMTGLVLSFLIGSGPGDAQTGLLNDTGQSFCFNPNNTLATCNAASVGNDGTLPHQDARYGRDAANAAGALAKIGAGAEGFDFTRICWNGSPEGTTTGPNLCTGTLVANRTATPSATPATDWACTRDNVTGLMWSLQTQSGDWATVNGATFPNAGHNTPARCGASSGWRVPNIRELFSISHLGAVSLPIDSTYFPQTEFERYWSADASSSSTGLAWAVFYHERGGPQVSIKSISSFVRLVHSAAPPLLSVYQTNPDGTVTDTTTGLIWDRCSLGLSGANCDASVAQRFTWIDALREISARNSANHLGFSDWRLPNTKELQSLVRTNTVPTFDTITFPNTPLGQTQVGNVLEINNYWASTTASANARHAWLTNFAQGGNSPYLFKTEAYFVRLVRGGSGASGFNRFPSAACNLDIDGDTQRTAEVDGVLLLRYLLGMRDTGLTDGFTLTGTRNTAALIEAFIGNAERYEVFGRTAISAEAFRDALILVRLMQGVGDDALLNAIELPANAVHITPAAVRQHVNTKCGTGF
jgi:hypothetical protein